MRSKFVTPILFVGLICSTLILAQTVEGQELRTEVFQIRHISLQRVGVLIEPLLSEKGSMIVHAEGSVLIVTDAPEQLRRVQEALIGFDRPPAGVEMVVKLIRASRIEGEEEHMEISDEIREMQPKLDILRYSKYELLDSAILNGVEDEVSSITLAQNYRIGFTVSYINERDGIVTLKRFTLEKRSTDEEWTDLLQATLNLPDRETVIVGASRMSAENASSLILILSASIVRREPSRVEE